ncbi:MAG: DUF1887 family CARF protein [candidate division KSB1 bacterium]|nr:DUF1887 family CARF protein [candidate division KSB1 bacterium]MDZ7365946.1 DUF1887 family CARF protein [candidate division KSB1 bacterium]MDZ7403820.1 DUF1887 family CARF protein [candidate division KSB1 bacterium]
MTQNVRVLVIGGRFAPHLLGIVAEPPDVVEFIVSQDNPGQGKLAKEALQPFVNLQISDDPLFINAYDLQQGREACREIAARHPKAVITFDVTSAPKIPSFAALDVARELSQRLIFVDSSNGKIRNVVPENQATTLEIRVDLEQYLRCYGRRAEETFAPHALSISYEKACEAADYLGKGDAIVVETLANLRSWSQGKDKRTIPFQKTKPVTPPSYAVLQRLAELGLIKALQQDAEGRISYQLTCDHDYKFLDGKWLEFFVYLQVKACSDHAGAPLFNDVRMSVEIPSNGARKEIDVACMFHGQLILCSCKTAHPFRTEYLDELRAVSDLVGGDFTTRLFVTNILPTTESDVEKYGNYDKFLQQAHDRKIIVVAGDRLGDIGAILKQAATNPKYARI